MGVVFFLAFMIFIFAGSGTAILIGFVLWNLQKKKRNIIVRIISVLLIITGSVIYLIPHVWYMETGIEKRIEEYNEEQYRETLAGLIGDGNYDRAVALLESGEHPDSCPDTLTPLMQACWNPDGYDIAELLIERGADVNAVYQGNPKRYLTREGYTPIMFAADIYAEETVKLLIENGADVNHQAAMGESALMEACYNNSMSLVVMLIENGADINAVDAEGKSALAYAISSNLEYAPEYSLVEYLLRNGADVNVITNDGKTLFDFMAVKRHDNFVQNYYDEYEDYYYTHEFTGIERLVRKYANNSQ
jgi:FOG: Ankyrin repeat